MIHGHAHATSRSAPAVLGPARSLWVAILALGAFTAVVAASGRGLTWLLIYGWALAAAVLLPYRRELLGLLGVATVALALAGAIIGVEDPFNAVMHGLFPTLIYRLMGKMCGDALVLEREAEILAESADNARAREARLRLAREVHDGLGAALTAAALNGEVAARALQVEPERSTRSLGRMRELLFDGEAQLARLGAAWTGPSIAWAAVERDLRRFATAVLEPEGVRLRFDSAIDDEALLAPETGAGLTSAVNELLANAARHARAREVRVVAWIENGSVCVSVEDDGQGASHAVAGFGWSGLERRARAMGGSFERAEPKGGGTRLVLRVAPSGEA